MSDKEHKVLLRVLCLVAGITTLLLLYCLYTTLGA